MYNNTANLPPRLILNDNNCLDKVNGKTKMIIEEINAKQGITSIIYTPEELMVMAKK